MPLQAINHHLNATTMKLFLPTILFIFIIANMVQAQDCYCKIYGYNPNPIVQNKHKTLYIMTIIIPRSECLGPMTIGVNNLNPQQFWGEPGGTVLTQENMQDIISEIRGLTNALTEKINRDREGMRTEVAQNNQQIRDEVVNKLDALPRNIVAEEVIQEMKVQITENVINQLQKKNTGAEGSN